VRRGTVAAAAAVLEVAIAVHAVLLLGQNLVFRHGYDRPCLRLIKSTNSLVTPNQSATRIRERLKLYESITGT
jgi:hypothetical protein